MPFQPPLDLRAAFPAILAQSAIIYALLRIPPKVPLSRQNSREPDPKARQPTPGSGDLCLLTRRPLPEIGQRLQELGIAVEEGPVDRTGAPRPLRSIYVRDPDGNLVEIANER